MIQNDKHGRVILLGFVLLPLVVVIDWRFALMCVQQFDLVFYCFNERGSQNHSPGLAVATFLFVFFLEGGGDGCQGAVTHSQ